MSLRWANRQKESHEVELINKKSDLSGGDILFLISCHEIVDSNDRAKYASALVIHASDLPKGRGWSPHIWQIVEGKNEVVVSLLEAEDSIDSGAIWAQRKMQYEGHELSDEINKILFQTELDLMDYAVANFRKILPTEQKDEDATYYALRDYKDSKLDPEKSIAEQFDLIRVCDPERYPAYFDYRGKRYILKLEKDKR